MRSVHPFLRGLMFRRLTALFMLVIATTGSVETTVGEVRDGEVHHESVATASRHAHGARGDHGHEDRNGSVEHGPDHQHGTAADHCTHAHGPALTTPQRLEVTVTVHHVALLEHHPAAPEASRVPHRRPPRA